ncbi:hypothetical protein JAAARDRAFT_52475 [Jaapia argillacea MUCL 33604]|uniref:PX domain-containing protein n=1 Tax=Jaapia argillacea MUCL 33604 TaxID=933084 RepID=A0A067QBT5_9AGAM|nr:hypothetical protein JAAARDRAFT_52475 [Jaapia argillacea MUCL 33604]
MDQQQIHNVQGNIAQDSSKDTPNPPRINTNQPPPPEAHLTVSPTSSTPTSSAPLTPILAHYLKKSLIQLQFHHELDLITTAVPNNVSTFSYLGRPFHPPPKDAPHLDLPFLRWVFRQFILTFPFLKDAPKDFFPDKLQPFMASLLSRNLSPTSIFDDPSSSGASEQATRLKLLGKLEKNLAMFLGSATKLAEKEEVVRLSQSDLDRLEMVAKKRYAREMRMRDTFDVNVVCVRTVVEKGRVRSRVHEEFVIRTRRNNQPDTFVSRRYGDFRTLFDELRKVHPEEQIRPPPAKDRRIVTAPPSSPTSTSYASSTSAYVSSMFGWPSSSASGSQESLGHTTSGWSGSGSNSPTKRSFGGGGGGQNGNGHVSPSLSSPSASTATLLPNQPPPPQNSGGSLSREKNRLTLRSYLHLLLSNPALASSPVLRSFLTSSPTVLSSGERDDARRREEADRMREEGRKRFGEEVKGRVEGLREAVRGVRGEIVGKDGLTHIFGTIKVTENVRDLPANYQAVLEWARISLASTVFHHLVAADNASETLASLKRIHGLMPYFMLKAALKITNPVGMIRSVLDLFLAQPFGGRSLLQRMFTSSLMEEVKALEEDIEAVKDKVDDPMLCEKIRLFVYAPREIQEVYKADAAAENLNILTSILRSSENPTLSRPQLHRVMRAHRAHIEYTRYRSSLSDPDDDEGPEDEDAWLYEDLGVLARLYERLRDRQELIGLIFEGVTAELLKDIITIFYAPLAQVYRAASIADSIGDLQTFINDLIKTVEATEELSQEDPGKTVQIFIDLIQRHEQAFYNFVHKVHSKGEGLFDNLMRWIELFLTVIREGVHSPEVDFIPGSNKISLEYLLPHIGPDREAVLKEVDEVAKYHYKLKLAYEDKIRRRFGKTRAEGGGEAGEDEVAAQLVDGVVRDLSFGELVRGDADELAAEVEEDESDDDDEDDREEESESESDSEESSGSGSESDTESSTETEEGPRTKPVVRSRTVGHGPGPAQSHRTPIPKSPLGQAPIVPPPPEKPITPAVRPSRSMTFSHSSRPGRDTHPPPVPHLHSKHRSGSPSLSSIQPPRSSRDKPLPLSPQRLHASLDEPRRQQRPPRPAASPPTEKPKLKRKRTAPQPITKPELNHLPQLLPVFVEMMRPLLRPQQA